MPAWRNGGEKERRIEVEKEKNWEEVIYEHKKAKRMIFSEVRKSLIKKKYNVDL